MNASSRAVDPRALRRGYVHAHVAARLRPVPRGRARRASDAGAPATGLAGQARLVAALCEPGRLCAGPVRLLETHISYVLLTGTHAYKIKKAIKLGFLDFSTLALRRLCCERELLLNRRLAPELYLDVVRITGTVEAPVLGGNGPVLEYAVKMREFPQYALLCNVLDRNELTPGHVDALAVCVAAFHATAPVASTASEHGQPRRVLEAALDNFAAIRPLLDDESERAAAVALEQWTHREYLVRRDAFERRQREGSIRECHGDLHLANIALVDGTIRILDCIEFNDAMRWIDVLSEVAFTVMDLEHRGHAHFARRFLSAYLESSGDYAGAAVLRFYLVYRAMVRAKVVCLRAAQLPHVPARTALQSECSAYLRLAASYAGATRSAVVLMHGPSGCGKTTLSQLLLERTGALRIRTDVERKRLGGLPAGGRSGSAIASGLYADDTTRRTYGHVLACARAALEGGFIALADGAFLQRWQRDMFRELAAVRGVPFVIVDCVAAPASLRARVSARARAGTDASEADLAVLEHQLKSAEPLCLDELAFTVACDAEAPHAYACSAGAWREVIERMRRRGAPPARPVTTPVDPVLGAKVAFLSRPSSYPERVSVVEPIETHMSWVFLTERHAYKLKKPVRNAFFDLRSVEARERNCAEELRVNRRFGTGVYLGVVPLTLQSSGELRLEGPGETTDWLVRMRRLPADRMLDRLIASGRLRLSELRPVVELLCRVYRRSPGATLSEQEYRRRFADEAADIRRELCRPELALPADLIERVCAQQQAFLAHTGHFHDRMRDRIVEGHGDLRPEHVCLEAVPQIIDSLEFSRDLRTLDAADELGFLALECERLGAPEAGRYMFEIYQRASGDSPPHALVHFYQSFRACVRARLAIRHLLDPAVGDHARWTLVARRYLDLARLHIEQCR